LEKKKKKKKIQKKKKKKKKKENKSRVEKTSRGEGAKKKKGETLGGLHFVKPQNRNEYGIAKKGIKKANQNCLCGMGGREIRKELVQGRRQANVRRLVSKKKIC